MMLQIQNLHAMIFTESSASLPPIALAKVEWKADHWDAKKVEWRADDLLKSC